MKSTGIVRGIDNLGRIVLPKELRTSMKLETDSKLEIFVEGDQIILKKHRPAGSCDFCGADASCVPLRAGGGSARYFTAFTRDGGIH